MRDAEAASYIRAKLPLAVVEGSGGIRLHLATPSSRLSRLVPAGGAPYWAHAWPGGVALAAHLAASPAAVEGRAVLDLGAGSGLAGIAAVRAGAARVVAVDRDPMAAQAVALNAAANEVSIEATTIPTLADAPMAEVVLVGDLFYDKALAVDVAAALDLRSTWGATVLVGDIGRRWLPRARLEALASYPVRDVGDGPTVAMREGWVFRWKRPRSETGAPKGAR